MSEQSAGADNSTFKGRGKTAKLWRAYLDALRANDASGAYRIAAEALGDGVPLAGLYQHVVAPAMHELGRLWEKGAITIADEHLATALTHRVLAALRPPGLLNQAFEPGSSKPRAMLAAVQGEQHALGLRMAADLLEEAGYQTIYLGADVPDYALLQAIESLTPSLLGLSATMPEFGPRLEEIASTVRQRHPRLSLFVGGQALASDQVPEAMPVNDLERFGDLVRPR